MQGQSINSTFQKSQAIFQVLNMFEQSWDQLRSKRTVVATAWWELWLAFQTGTQC